MIDSFLKICGAISVVAAALAILYKVYRYLQPVTASISYTISALKENPDSIAVTITNRSSAPIYVQSCSIRCTYSDFELIKRHLKKPFLRPSLYPNLRYNSCVYQFVGAEPIKIDPSEQKTLSKNIYEHPLNALYGPKLISFVTLTSGRTVISKKMPCPQIWRMIGSRGKRKG